MSEHRITLSCAACGSEDFRLPTEPKPDDMVTCAGCGATSRYDEIQKAAIEKGQEAIRKAFSGLFKK